MWASPVSLEPAQGATQLRHKTTASLESQELVPLQSGHSSSSSNMFTHGVASAEKQQIWQEKVNCSTPPLPGRPVNPGVWTPLPSARTPQWPWAHRAPASATPSKPGTSQTCSALAGSQQPGDPSDRLKLLPKGGLAPPNGPRLSLMRTSIL